MDLLKSNELKVSRCVRGLVAAGSMWLLCGCQMGYIISSAYNQLDLLTSGVSLETALKDPNLTERERSQLQLTMKVREFAGSRLHLNVKKNYTKYVKLDREYVTYVVNAAEKWQLKAYLWSFPIVGDVPYKGYFNEADAKEEEANLKKKGLDTFFRGVSAYSTLGWFKDPLLSSMVKYEPHDLVNTIIHESVHATLYIGSSADFNERMAVFLGNKGMELYYRELEGADSETLRAVKEEAQDEKLFSEFISAELKQLEAWYESLGESDRQEEKRLERIAQIQQNFRVTLVPKLQTKSYLRFGEISLNNARLVLYKTYMEDISDFEALFQSVDGDFEKFLAKCKTLKDHDDPEKGLKELVSPSRRD